MVMMDDNDKNCKSSTLTHREWRRIAKRERRRRIRRRAAQQRDSDEEHLRAKLESTAEYSNWIVEQLRVKHEREVAEKREHAEREKLWLEEEVRAQKEWRILRERKAKIRQEQLLQEELIRKDFETKQAALRMKREETRRQHEEEMKRHQDMQKEIDDYIDNGADTPECLRIVSETQSGKEPCPFFTKTGVCRYGDICSRNHRRLALSKVILVPGFYSHFSLEKNSAEYDTDICLEYESSETRRHFREFYESVLPELESFGRIKTLKYCRNSEIHLRGNLYIEYYTEREAARACRKLKGRYYAQRQLNCEFVNLTSWRNAVCGMAKCPKGRACNFLHTFRNPNDEYDIKSPPRWSKKNDHSESCRSGRSEHSRSRCKRDDWDRASIESDARNWRWSESPEPKTESRGEKYETRSHSSVENEHRGDRRDDSRNDRKHDNVEGSSRIPRRDRDSQKREISSRRSRRKEESSKRDKNSSRNRWKKSKKKRREQSTSDEETKERDSDSRRSKRSKRRSRSGEDRHRESKCSKEESGRETRNEKKQSNEKIDTNANDLRRSASGIIEKINNKEESNAGPKTTSSASENEWNTTESD